MARVLVRHYRNNAETDFMQLLRGKENLMKLKTRVKAGKLASNHNTIVR